MRHRKSGRKLGRTKSHRKALLSNLVRSLFIEEKIKTTEARGKEVMSLADRLITLGKGANVFILRSIVSGSTPSSRATATAARMLVALCRPRRAAIISNH